MSKLKRKSLNPKPKKVKQDLNFKTFLQEQLYIKRNLLKLEDDKKVEELIKEGKLQLILNTLSTLRKIAEELKWPTTRLNRSLDRIIKYREIQEKKKLEEEKKKNETDQAEN